MQALLRVSLAFQTASAYLLQVRSPCLQAVRATKSILLRKKRLIITRSFCFAMATTSLNAFGVSLRKQEGEAVLVLVLRRLLWVTKQAQGLVSRRESKHQLQSARAKDLDDQACCCHCKRNTRACFPKGKQASVTSKLLTACMQARLKQSGRVVLLLQWQQQARLQPSFIVFQGTLLVLLLQWQQQGRASAPEEGVTWFL